MLAVTQRAMEEKMLVNQTLYQISGVNEIVVTTKESRIRWTGYAYLPC